MIKAVIFDMDGVIVNSEPLHKKAYYNMFKDFKLDVSESLYESFTGKSTYSICEQLCLKFNLSITPYELVNSKRKHFKYIFENDKSFKMIDGAFELIKDYYKNNLNEGLIGIIASRLKEYFNKPAIVITNSKNLLKYFTASQSFFSI